MATLVTVRQGTKFGPEYVTMLRRMAYQFAGTTLVTLTDQADTPGYTMPLKADLHGWWAKLELFAPWNQDLRPCIYVDLDTFIVGDIRDWEPDDDLWLIRDFYRPERSNSGVMMIPKFTGMLWDLGKTYMQGNPQAGDGDFLTKMEHQILNDRFDGIVSYKVHCRDALSSKAKVVCFHGAPKPHRVNGWAGDFWAQWT